MELISPIQQWDEQLFVLINQKLASASLDGLMSILSSKYTFIFYYLATVIWFVFRFKNKFYIPLLTALLAFALADSISAKIFKPSFKRLRPAFEENLNPRLPDGLPGGKFGFVSSHAANTFALYPLLLFLSFTNGPKKPCTIERSKYRFCFSIVVLISLFVCYSRVYLGVHYPGDVIGGALLGIIIGESIKQVYLRYVWNKWIDTKSI
ncbi:MAG: phosphatase PAP2 family protein [Bacteroidia bacterium]